MNMRNDLSAAAGHTPLVRLREASDVTGCDILATAKLLHRGDSTKDRTALGLLLEPKQCGQLLPGELNVEGSSGSTGIGLTLIAASRGYCGAIFMPETQSREKIGALRMAGAEARLVPAAPYKSPGHYAPQPRAYAECMNTGSPGTACFAKQIDNTASRDFQESSTGA